jgi:hypothetical protein
MPISIPTSIAGISVPGTINGPLQLLYGNKYEFGTHRYPRNLGTDSTRSHVIRFTSMKPDPNAQPATFSQGAEALRLLDENNFSGAAGKAKAAFNELVAADVLRKVHETISLYIPDTVNVQYSTQYDSSTQLTSTLGKPYFLAQAGTSLTDLLMKKGDSAEKIGNNVANDPYLRAAAASLLGKLPGVGGDLQPLALRALGQAFNPQLQVLFQQVNFRSFQFDFLFTPYSKEETETVKKIIKSFKFAAAPQIKRGSFGFAESLFVDVPYPFEIEFLYKGKANEYVHKIGRSVLENISVDYGPNGWATFNDGSPVQIRMSLQFTETVIVDKNRILEGF